MGCCCSKDDNSQSSKKRKTQKDKSKSTSYLRAASTRKRASERESEKGRCLYVALWDYEKGSNAELTFSKGDVFKELGDECDAGPDWMFVTQESAVGSGSQKKTARAGTGTGYIPRNFVAPLRSLEAEKYWFGKISRAEADTYLKGTPNGTFLLRSRPGGEFMPQYALSVSHEGRVKHFKIHCNQNPASPAYFLGRKRFGDIREVVPWFKDVRNTGICCSLVNSPTRPPPQRSVISAEIGKHWQEIPRSQIHIECEVGKGFYGVVHRGTWEPTPGVKLQVAVKELKRGVTGGRDDFLAEAVAMKSLRHERLVKLHGVVSADEPFYIITEYIRDGSLRFYLKRRAREKRYLEEAQLVAIVCQVAEGMRYLEERKVVHRDLAARNVLIQEVDNGEKPGKVSPSQQFDVKIADFGLAHMMKTGNAMQEKRVLNLPTKWMAPEALTEGRFSSASDVWSFGILLHEVFSHGKEPYEGLTTQQTRKYILEERRQLERVPEMPEDVYGLLLNCCEFSVSARPKFQHIHCYLQSYYEMGAHYYQYERQKPEEA